MKDHVIVWINGPFGVGKSSVVAELARLWPHATVVDPEEFGYLLWRWTPGGREATSDFQDRVVWRELVVATLGGVWREFGRPLLVPMTLLNPTYFDEVVGKLREQGVVVQHFCLTAPREVVFDRLRRRGGDSIDWALERFDRYEPSLLDSRFETFIDARARSALELASDIAGRVRLAT